MCAHEPAVDDADALAAAGRDVPRALGVDQIEVLLRINRVVGLERDEEQRDRARDEDHAPEIIVDRARAGARRRPYICVRNYGTGTASKTRRTTSSGFTSCASASNVRCTRCRSTSR